MELYRTYFSEDNIIVERVIQLLVDLITRDRMGISDVRSIGTCKKILCSLSDSFLFREFENRLLEETSKFFQDESRRLQETTKSSSFGTLCDRTIDLIYEERDRSLRFSYYRSCFSEIKNIVIKELIIDTNQKIFSSNESWKLSPETFLSTIKLFIDTSNIEGLKRAYEFFNLCEQSTITKFASRELGPFFDQYTCISTKYENPERIIENVLLLRSKYENWIKQSNENETMSNSEICDTINRIFIRCISKFPRFAEYLSLYLDSIIRTGESQGDDDLLYKKLDEIISLLKILSSGTLSEDVDKKKKRLREKKKKKRDRKTRTRKACPSQGIILGMDFRPSTISLARDGPEEAWDGQSNLGQQKF